MALVSLSTVKTLLNISGTTYDALLNQLIDIAQSQLEAYLCRKLENTTYTDEPLQYQFSRFDRGDQSGSLGVFEEYGRLFLKNYPVITFINLKYDGDVIDPDNYIVQNDIGIIYTKKLLNDADLKLTATYSAGYTTSTIPQLLKWSIVELVRLMFENASSTFASNSSNVTSKRIGDYSVTYGNNLSIFNNFFSNNSTILNQYKIIYL